MQVVWVLSLLLAAISFIGLEIFSGEIEYATDLNKDGVYLLAMSIMLVWAAILIVIQYLTLGTLDPHKFFNNSLFDSNDDNEK